jgi:hypothetical protein
MVGILILLEGSPRSSLVAGPFEDGVDTARRAHSLPPLRAQLAQWRARTGWSKARAGDRDDIRRGEARLGVRWGGGSRAENCGLRETGRDGRATRGVGLHEEETGGNTPEIGNPAAEGGRAARHRIGIVGARRESKCTSSPRPWTGKTPIPAGKKFGEARDWAGFSATTAYFGSTETPPACPAAKPRKVKGYSDSNQQPSDYGTWQPWRPSRLRMRIRP